MWTACATRATCSGTGAAIGVCSGDGVGARSAFARVNVDRVFGGAIEASYRQLDNEDYSGGNYETATQIDARYSRPWEQMFVGGEITAGHDVFGESYSRVGAFIRF